MVSGDDIGEKSFEPIGEVFWVKVKDDICLDKSMGDNGILAYFDYCNC